MKFPKEDFPLIRASVILLTVTLLLTAAAIYGTAGLKEMSERDKSTSQKQLNDARQQLAQINEEEQKIRQYLDIYQKIMSQGMMGEGNRLDWLEHLAKIKENNRLYELKYQLSAQQPVSVDPSLPQGDIKLFASNLQLEISMLHEGQLLEALKDLKGNNKGILVPRECTLSRIGKDIAMTTTTANIKAKCLSAWVTLHTSTMPISTK